MPKVKKGASYKKVYTEEDLEKAVNDVKEGKSKREVSKTYLIPRSTLQFRMSDSFVKTTPGLPPVLGTETEKEIADWIIDCHEKGFPRRKENVQASIKNYLDQSSLKTPFRNNIPGDGWYKNFLRRNLHITERFPEGVTSASSCVSEQNIRSWFNQIYNYLKKDNYLDILNDPTRVFNSDETYFNVCPKMKNVLAPRGARNVYEVESGNSKLNLTVLFTFSASGVTTPPTIVFPYTRLPSVVARSVPDHWGIGVTPSGWMNDELFSEYLTNIFHPYLLREKIKLPVILFVDGHSSHVTLKVSQLCTNLQIILICLYPNATRIMQPADVSAFKPLKNMWKKGVLRWRQTHPTEMLSLDKMAPLLLEAVNNFSSDTSAVTNGFKASGLYPWDPEAIDYSKCLARSHKASTSHDTEQKIIKTSHDMNLSTFIEMIRPSLYNELSFYTVDSETEANKSEELFIVFE